MTMQGLFCLALLPLLVRADMYDQMMLDERTVDIETPRTYGSNRRLFQYLVTGAQPSAAAAQPPAMMQSVEDGKEFSLLAPTIVGQACDSMF